MREEGGQTSHFPTVTGDDGAPPPHLSSGTCPACDLDIPPERCGSPHCRQREREVERIMSLSDEAVMAEVRAAGGDPEAIAAEMKAEIETVIVRHARRIRGEG